MYITSVEPSFSCPFGWFLSFRRLWVNGQICRLETSMMPPADLIDWILHSLFKKGRTYIWRKPYLDESGWTIQPYSAYCLEVKLLGSTIKNVCVWILRGLFAVCAMGEERTALKEKLSGFKAQEKRRFRDLVLRGVRRFLCFFEG